MDTMPTIYNEQTGAWEDSATWHKGIVPSSTDDVVLDWITPDRRTVTTVNGTDAAASLDVGPGNELTLNETRDNPGQLTVTGEVLVEHGGVIDGAGTLIAGSIHNDGFISSSGTAGARFNDLHIETGTLFNSGELYAGDGHSLQVNGNLNNSGEVRGVSDSSITFGNVTNSGSMSVFDRGSDISVDGTLNNSGSISASHDGLFSVSGNVSNTGGLVALTSGVLDFAEGVINTAGGYLSVSGGGTIEIGGSAIGGLATLGGSGSELMFNGGASTTNVEFTGTNDTFLLGNAQSYSGSVSRFYKGDVIDARDIGFDPSYDSYNPTTKLLTLGDGTQTAEIKIVGTYVASDFSFHSDSHGGTDVLYA
jgi:hypothetical protein